MGKVNITISIDPEVDTKLTETGEKKSDFINKVLKNYLLGEEGINRLINYYKQKIDTLEAESKRLKKEKEEKINNISKEAKGQLKEDKKILDRRPGLSNIRSKLFNERNGTNFTEPEYLELIKRWT